MSDQEILNIFYTNKGRINPHKTKDEFLNNNVHLKTYLLNRYPDSSSIVETLYRIKFNVETRPTCKCCGGYVAYVGPNKNGFAEFCSTSCSRLYIKLSKELEITDEIIIQDIYVGNKINYNKLKEKYLIEHGYKEYLIHRYELFNSYIEVIYRIINNVLEIPICKKCNKVKKFKSFELGYKCSKECELTEDITDEYIKELYSHGFKGYVMKPAFLEKTGIKQYLDTKFSEELSYREKIYRICHDIQDAPKCPICGNTIKFSLLLNAYPACCSGVCTKLLQILNKEISQNITDEDVISYVKKYKFPNRIQELKSTGLYEYVLNRFNSKDINENLYRIVNHIEEVPVCSYCGDKLKFISYTKGYHEFCSAACAIRNNVSMQYRNIYHWDVKFLKNNEVFIKKYCKIHGNITLSLSDFNNRLKNDRYYEGCLCLLCHPKVVNSFLETRIETIIKDILIKNNIAFILHDRTLIKPKELDFFLPDINVGIECNGLYWHSQLLKDNKKVLLLKLNMCLEKNINLIVLWEDEILFDTKLELNLLIRLLNKQECLLKRFYYNINSNERITDKDILIKYNKLSTKILFERYNVYRCWTI